MTPPAAVPLPSATDSAAVRSHRCVPIQIRFNDVDRYGHVNNNAYFAFYDLGKEDYLAHVLRVDYREQDVVPVVANINADFIHPIFHGDDIVVETRICHVGRKSFTLQQRAVNARTGEEMCRCATVMVCYSLSAQESADIPEEYRRAIAACEGESVFSTPEINPTT